MQCRVLLFTIIVTIGLTTQVLAQTTPNGFDPQSLSWWQVPVKTSWQIQLNGSINTTYRVKAYDIDLFDASQKVIDSLHAQGVKVICYFSAGSFEDWRSDASSFPASVKGKSNGWAGENWLDIRATNILLPIMEKRIQLASNKKCDAVDPDNVDGFTNDTGFPLSDADQLAYNKALADLAHQHGMAVGLKNDLLQIPDLVGVYDFAINEQCLQYNECHLLKPFIDAGKAVFHIEYSGTLTNICKKTSGTQFSTVKKRWDLKAWMQACP